MRFLVYGTGAVGGYLGGRLAESGNSVVFLARPEMASAMKANGLRLEHNGAARTIPVPEVVTELPTEFDLGDDAAVLLTVPAFDCALAAEMLRARLRRPVPVVCLLNGIGNEETLANSIGAEQVLPATLTTAVTVRAPGIVHVERERGLGLARGGTAERLAEVFRHAGLEVRQYTDTAAMKWSKVPTNIVANASSAILGWPVADVMDRPGLYRLEVEALRETFRVMRRAGHRPVDLPGVPIRWLAGGIFLPTWITHPWLSRAVARGRGDRRPSFHRYIGRGRSEAPWLNGAVVDHGARTGVPTPGNRTLLSAYLELVERRSDPSAWRDRPDRLLERAREMGVPGL